MHRGTILALFVSILFCSPVLARQWAVEMFETTRHDFGSVARDAKAEYVFVLKNTYVEDVHIAGVRSSCGCTRVRIDKTLLKTHESGAIVAAINTGAFLGNKGATITVTLDKPFYAEVQLHVRAYIRSDVVLRPGSVDLGNVDQRTAVDRTITIDHAGRGDWRVLEVTSDNPHLSGEVVETRRTGGRVSYELAVHLDENALTGYINDYLILRTSDRRLTQVPVLVEGRVLSPITVSPASLFLGVLQPGQTVKKHLVVRGKKPFRVVSVTCDAESFQFDVSDEQEPKSVHLIPVIFVAGDEPGEVYQKIQIETDLIDCAQELSAYAEIISQ
jgi:hypothetical protein